MSHSSAASSTDDALPVPPPAPLSALPAMLLPHHSTPQTLSLSAGRLASISASASCSTSASEPLQTASLLALPSLCHPHLHLDKPYLLTHPSTSHLRPETGSFSEALSLTAAAKPLYTPASLAARADALLAASSRAGVTHARAFAEVDSALGHVALDAALAARARWAGRLQVQVCAFAQEPVFSGPHGAANRRLAEAAAARAGVEALGATPYVEDGPAGEARCVDWAVRTALAAGLHLDLHLDYSLDRGREPAVWGVLAALRRHRWAEAAPGKTVVLGHCTRLTALAPAEWARLRAEVDGLPVFFVGLPTSDLFMMGRPPEGAGLADRPRATLQVPAMLATGFRACLGVNNVGNAFTPYGSADPLALAQWGVGLYQAATPAAAELLFDCVSRGAKQAIGLLDDSDDGADATRRPGELRPGDPADFVLVGRPEGDEGFAYRRHRRVCEVVWDAGAHRQTVLNGHWIRME